MATGNRLVDCEERGCSICRTTQFELKCLPCAHNVCTECLHNVTDDLSGRTPSVYCPVDSSEFPLKSINGIDSLPTKGHLVEVSSRTDGYFLHWSPDMGSNVHDDTSDNPEMHELLTYTQEYRNDLADTIRNMEHGIQASLSLQEERVKEEIRSTSEALVKVISAKEQELYQEVDRVIEAEKKGGQQEVADFALQAHHIIQVVEVNHAKFKEGRRDESLMKQVHTELQAVKKHKSVLEEKLKRVSKISFVPNEYCFEAPLGRVKCNRPPKEQEIPRRKSMEDGPSRRSSTQGQLKRKPSQVFRVIVPPSPLSEKFRPWALSVSETGHIAVVDRGNNCIHIFNPKGDFLRYVAKPYGSKSVELYGVTFVSRNTFALAEYSPSPGSGCLLEMSISGEHLRIIGNLKGPAHVTSFPSTSNACKNVIAVYYTNSFDSPDVFVAKDEQKVCLPLGRNALSRPQKVLVEIFNTFLGQRPGRQEPIYECYEAQDGRNEKRRKTIDQKIQYGLDKCSTANFDDCNVQFLDPRERWRKMSIRGLNETDELQRKNARIKAHLKSDINYNWERIMQDGDRGKPTLRKKEHNKTSRFFGFASRGNKLEWTQERKKKICKRNFQIPTIVVTEAL